MNTTQVKAWFTKARIAYAAASVLVAVVTGAVGHCYAVATVEPRVAKLEAQMVSAEHTLAEVKGWVKGIAFRIGAERIYDHE